MFGFVGILLRRLRRTVGAPGFKPFNYPQFCLLFQTFTKMPLKRLSSRPARSKLCPLFGSESSPNSSPKPLNSYLWVIERALSRGKGSEEFWASALASFEYDTI